MEEADVVSFKVPSQHVLADTEKITKTFNQTIRMPSLHADISLTAICIYNFGTQVSIRSLVPSYPLGTNHIQKTQPLYVAWRRPHRKHVSCVRLRVHWSVTSYGSGADEREVAASSIVACWTVFTELLPGNALIKSVTIWKRTMRCRFTKGKENDEKNEKMVSRRRFFRNLYISVFRKYHSKLLSGNVRNNPSSTCAAELSAGARDGTFDTS
jgi:hypothetical protein